MTTVALRNTYFNCHTSDGHPVPWKPPATEAAILPGAEYFGEALEAMDRRLASGGLTFYFTRDLERLPSYGPDVVAVVVADELTRVPAYFDRVRAIFKNQAVRPYPPSSFVRDPTITNLQAVVSHLRTWRHHVPGALAYRRAKATNPAGVAPIWSIPIGTLGGRDVAFTPFLERSTDVFFAGSVQHRADASKVATLLAPKISARKAMVDSASRLAARDPDIAVELATTAAFSESVLQDPQAYSRHLMNSRFALVPRGTTADTSRLLEALRFGCIAIADTVPRHPYFYADAPVVRLRRWNELEPVVQALRANPDRMARLHAEGIAWWEQKGSPAAVGRYMARSLDALAADISR